MTSAYDAVAYPAATFPQTHPDRLALIARLHGLAAPAVERARVLEIGGGDGFNAIALAAAFPDARFLSFDFSAAAVARGQALVAASGMDNVRIELADILNFARTVEPGGFDYVIAHGVYAWVPGAVREAVLVLAGRALSDEGVFFVSYNTLPGGHVRQVMREMLTHELNGVEGIEARMAAARAVLEDYAALRSGDDAVVSAIRAQAVAMLTRPDSVLFHDELGDVFAPQSLTRTVEASARQGLEFLDDSGKGRLGDGFLSDEATPEADASTAAIVRAAQSRDFAEMRFFRQNLYVRAGRKPARRPAHEAVRACYAAGQFAPGGDGAIVSADTTFALRDAKLQAWLLALGERWPRHRRVDAIADTPDRCEALYRLFAMGVLHLSTVPPPFVLEPGDIPRSSPLVLAQLALGHPTVTTLHFEKMRLKDPAARGLLACLDGTLDRAALAVRWAQLAHAPGIDLAAALDTIAAQRLLLPGAPTGLKQR